MYAHLMERDLDLEGTRHTLDAAPVAAVDIPAGGEPEQAPVLPLAVLTPHEIGAIGPYHVAALAGGMDMNPAQVRPVIAFAEALYPTRPPAAILKIVRAAGVISGRTTRSAHGLDLYNARAWMVG